MEAVLVDRTEELFGQVRDRVMVELLKSVAYHIWALDPDGKKNHGRDGTRHEILSIADQIEEGILGWLPAEATVRDYRTVDYSHYLKAMGKIERAQEYGVDVNIKYNDSRDIETIAKETGGGVTFFDRKKDVA